MKKILLVLTFLASFSSFANECEVFQDVNSSVLTAASVVQANDLNADINYLFTKGFEIKNNCPDGKLSDEFINSYCSKGRNVVGEVLTNISLLSAQGNTTADSLSSIMIEAAMSLRSYCEKLEK